MKFHAKSLIAILLTLSMSLSISAISEIETTENAETQVGLCEDFEAASQTELDEITADSEDYDVFVLLRFDYPDLDLQSLEGLSKEERRDTVRDYYKTKNEQIAAELGLENVSVSYSAPYAEIVYDSLDDYKDSRTDLVTAAKTDDVSYIGADIISVDNEEVNESTSSSADDYPLSFAFLDIKNTNNSYNGSGIKVGILESTRPKNMTNIPTNIIGGYYGETITNNHTSAVASIIGGTTGIASEAILYFACYDSNEPNSTSEYTFTKCLNWLLTTKQVDIINMSARYCFSSEYVKDPNFKFNGKYNESLKQLNSTVYINFCAYIDYVTIYNSCLLIKSAGNRGDSDREITKPGMAVNVLTVGATNSDWEVADLSSYIENDKLIGKPEVVAPGEKIVVPNIGTASGTSFAAPMVTGIAVKLMHEFPKLKTDAGLLKAVLMAGCDKLSSTDPIFSDKSGFGMINYKDSRAIMTNKQYATKAIIGDGRKTTVLYESAFSVTPGKTAAVRFSRAIEGQNCTPDSTVTSAIMVKYRVNITHTTSSGTVTDASFVWDGTVGYYDIKNNTSSDITYKIKITPEDRMYDAMEYIYITHENASHKHYYYQFVSVDSHRHSCTCICGNTIYEAHTNVSSGTCSKCGIIN